MFVALSCIHILNKTYMFLDVSVTKFMYNVFPNLIVIGTKCLIVSITLKLKNTWLICVNKR